MTRGPVLTGAKVRLRPMEARDADRIWESVQDAESMRLTGTTAQFTRAQIDEWAAGIADRPGRFDWAVTSLAPGCDQDVMVGEIVLNDMDPDMRASNIRLAFLPGHRGRGYGREALSLVLKFAFDGAPGDPGPQLHRLSLDVLSINPGAQRLYTSLGFQVEGRLRHAYRDGDEWVDAILMSILEDEYRMRPARPA